MTTACDAFASRMSDSEIGPTAAVDDFKIDLLALDFLERADERFERALHVAFYDHAQHLAAVSSAMLQKDFPA